MSDIAVLKIEAENLPTAEFADSDAVRVGQIACVIGAPYNFTYSFTTGVISGKGRGKEQNQHLLSNRWGGLFEDFLQTDASINPGNSGGPLLDIEGRVVGMNTLIQGINKGLGFAVSSNLLRKIGDELIAHGRIRRPWLGLGIQSVQDMNPRPGKSKHPTEGVLITSLSDDGPALKSDLRPNEDIILKVDDVPIKESVDLQREIQSKQVGQTVKLTVWRDGKEVTVPVATGEMPPNLQAGAADEDETLPPPNAPSTEDTPDEDRPEPIPPDADASEKNPPGLGMEVQVITPELAEARKLKAKTGLIVTEVTPKSEAAVAGVQVGDVITEVNSQPVSDEATFFKALENKDKAKGTLLLVEREGGNAFLVLKPAE
jgi:S1-C subfamily serine protease